MTLPQYVFIQRSQADFKPVMPTGEQLDQQIHRLKQAKKKASSIERKYLIKQVIKEMKILREQL